MFISFWIYLEKAHTGLILIPCSSVFLSNTDVYERLTEQISSQAYFMQIQNKMFSISFFTFNFELFIQGLKKYCQLKLTKFFFTVRQNFFKNADFYLFIYLLIYLFIYLFICIPLLVIRYIFEISNCVVFSKLPRMVSIRTKK